MALTSASTVTSVSDSASSQTIVAFNGARRELLIANDSTSTLYLKFGSTASSTDYSFKLATDEILATEYQGKIDGIWSADTASGAAKVTELLA